MLVLRGRHRAAERGRRRGRRGQQESGEFEIGKKGEKLEGCSEPQVR